jgi:hypothetical protein
MAPKVHLTSCSRWGDSSSVERKVFCAPSWESNRQSLVNETSMVPQDHCQRTICFIYCCLNKPDQGGLTGQMERLERAMTKNKSRSLKSGIKLGNPDVLVAEQVWAVFQGQPALLTVSDKWHPPLIMWRFLCSFVRDCFRGQPVEAASLLAAVVRSGKMKEEEDAVSCLSFQASLDWHTWLFV